MTDVQTITREALDFEVPMNLWPRAHRDAIFQDLVDYDMTQRHAERSAIETDLRYALFPEDRGDTYWAYNEYNHLSGFRTAVRTGAYTLTHLEPAAPVVTAAPIGPDTPGWSEWWDQLWEESNGDDESYVEEYNALARAFGMPEREGDNYEQDYAVTIRIPSFTVTVRVTARHRDVENDWAEELGEHIDEDAAERAAIEYLRNNSTEYELDDYETV